MTDVRPTRIEHFDREIGGGLTPGSIVGLVTPPDSQGEQLLRSISRGGDTIYVSTTRAADSIMEWVDAGRPDGGAPDIEVCYAGIDSVSPQGGEALRDWLAVAHAGGDTGPLGRGHTNAAAQLDLVLNTLTARRPAFAVIDPVNPLERADEAMYTRFLHHLQRHLREAGTTALLHLVETPDPPACRWLSLQMADEVWDLSVVIRNERVEFKLTISKSRNGSVPSEQIKFLLNEDVAIDTSRDI